MRRWHLKPVLVLFLFWAAIFPWRGQGENILDNGNFETDGGNAWPQGWPKKEGASWEREAGGNRFLRLKLLRPTQFLTLNRSVPIPTQAEALRLAVRVRFDDLYYGHEIWWDGRILLTFKDQNGNKVEPTPSAPNWNKGSKDWAGYSREFLVPPGAAALEIAPSLIRVKRGTLDLDDITLEVIPPEPLRAKARVAAEKQAEEAARQIAGVKASVPVVPADKLPPLLKVVGNHLETNTGQRQWLQGVSVPSLEWSESGEKVPAMVQMALSEWKANCIRLPVRASFWKGKGPYRKDGGAQYRQLVEDVVNLCAAHGAYLVLDLHGFNAPRQEDAEFWKDAAARYKNHPVVLFELFNEPHDIDWETWRNGGRITPPIQFAEAPPEDQIRPKPYQSVGMQQLLEAVRSTGAKNVVIAGGLDWGYDLSQVSGKFALSDPHGYGVMYSSHIYPWKKDWQSKVLEAAKKYPIFVGEVGTPPDYSNFTFIPVEERYPIEGWAEDVLGLIQKHRLNWTAWSFHDKAGPCLLEKDRVTPTPYWGVPAKAALGGKQFELKSLR